MMCWRQVHLHSLQTQHRPVLGVSIPAVLTGRFMASPCVCVLCVCVSSMCVCLCVGEREIGCVSRGEGRQAKFQQCCIPSISQSRFLPYFILPLSLYPSLLSLSLSVSSPWSPLTALGPFHSSAGSQAL